MKTRMIQVTTKKNGETTRQLLADTEKAKAWMIRETQIMAGATVSLKYVKVDVLFSSEA